jgi:hypothetical protein
MKLLYKYNRINYWVVIIIFIIASFSIYFLIKIVLVSQVDGDILSRQKELNASLGKLKEPPDSVHTFNQRFIYKKISSPLDSFYNIAV